MNNNFQLSQQADPNKIFLTKFSELEGRRFDPDYYKLSYKDVEYKIQTANTTEFLYKIADVFSGSTPAKLDYSNDETKYPIIKVASYQNDFIKLSKVSYTKQKNSASSKKNDIYILSSAHQANYVGRFMKYLNSKPKENTAFVGELLCVRGLKNNHKYLFSILNTEVYKTLINREKRGQTSHIYPKDIKNIKIPIPPKNIQANIVAKMDTAYQNKKDKEAQVQNLLDNIDTYLLNELGIDLPKPVDNSLKARIFTKKFSDIAGGRFDPFFNVLLFSQVENNIIQGKFNCVILDNLVFSVSGVTYTATDESKDGHAILRSNNIDLHNNELNFKKIRFIDENLKLSSSSKLYKNDILMSSASGSKKHVGKVAFIEKDMNYYFGAFMSVLRSKKIDYSHKYLFNFLSSKIYRLMLFRFLGGTNINNVGFEKIKNLPIPLPPLEKQNQIAEHISKIRAQAKQLQTEAKTGLEQVKKEVEAIILGDK